MPISKVAILLLVTLSLLSVGNVSSLKCSKTSDCQQVTNKLSYVRCLKNECKCLTWNGVKGNATTQSKCSCPFEEYKSKKNGIYCISCQKPRQVVYAHDGIPRCINVIQADLYEKQVEYQERNKDVVREAYNNLLYPKAYAILDDIVAGKPLPTIFSEHIKGRAVPAGEFSERKGFTEYLYGIPSSSGTQAVKMHFINLIAEKNQVYYRVDIEFSMVGGRPRNDNLTQIGTVTFNKKSQIVSIDLVNLNFGAFLDEWTNATRRIQVICYVAKNFCTGKNLQYNSDAECVSYLTVVPAGTFDRANSNTTACRLLHSHLAAIDPDGHCTHIGPSGGGKCIDFPYKDFYSKYY